jgi:hypothetical protein
MIKAESRLAIRGDLQIPPDTSTSTSFLKRLFNAHRLHTEITDFFSFKPRACSLIALDLKSGFSNEPQRPKKQKELNIRKETNLTASGRRIERVRERNSHANNFPATFDFFTVTSKESQPFSDDNLVQQAT